jgi:hypothetical protein
LHPVTLVDPVTLPDGAVRAVLDLGKPGLKHSEVRLDIDGRDFVRRTRIEVSYDEARWGTLGDGAVIYRIESATTPASHLTIRYPISDARYVRVTIQPGHDGKVLRVAGAQVYYTQAASEPLVRAVPAKLEASVLDPKARVSQTVLDFGEPGVPLQALVLTIPTASFERRAVVQATNFKTYWPPLGAGVLFRFPRDESTRLEIAPARKRYFRVEISDGDDPPLPIEAAYAEYRVEELVFRAEEPGTHLLYVGSESLGAPSYDFPAVLARAGEVRLANAGWGSLEPNTEFGKAPQPPKPWTERFKGPIAIGLALVLLALALWTIRLLRRPAA